MNYSSSICRTNHLFLKKTVPSMLEGTPSAPIIAFWRNPGNLKQFVKAGSFYGIFPPPSTTTFQTTFLRALQIASDENNNNRYRKMIFTRFEAASCTLTANCVALIGHKVMLLVAYKSLFFIYFCIGFGNLDVITQTEVWLAQTYSNQELFTGSNKNPRPLLKTWTFISDLEKLD